MITIYLFFKLMFIVIAWFFATLFELIKNLFIIFAAISGLKSR